MGEQNSLSRLQQLLRELKRRKIFRVAIVYGGVAFIILQLADLAGPAMNMPAWTTGLVIIILGIGFVIALISAWAFEITPDGVVRMTEPEETRGEELPRHGKPFTGNGVIIALLVIIAGILLYPSVFSGGSAGNPEQSEAVEVAGFIPPLGEKSIAVLPFTYISNEDSYDYFSLGMTDELLSRLAQIGELSVIARTSVMQYLDTDKTMTEIGRELGVATLLEGSVQLVGDRVRIQAQLINAGNGTHIWANSYDRQIEDVLSLQSEVTTQIAEALQATLLPQEQQQLANQRQVDSDAYYLYLRAQQIRNQRDSESLNQAIGLYRQAIARDSTFAPAYGGLAYASILYAFEGGEINQPQALEFSRLALERDSTVMDAYLAQGLIHSLNGNLDTAVESFQKGLQINPNHAEMIRELGWYYDRRGQLDSALVQMQRGVELDPLEWHSHHSLGWILFENRQYEQAVAELQTALDLGSQFPTTYQYVVLAYTKQSQLLIRQGENEQADQLLERMEGLALTNGLIIDSQIIDIFKYAVRGQADQALSLLERFDIDTYEQMVINLLSGRTESSLDLFEQVRNDNPVLISKRNPIFDPIRNDPRFEQL